jgi:hypothetical protein
VEIFVSAKRCLVVAFIEKSLLLVKPSMVMRGKEPELLPTESGKTCGGDA